MNAAKSAINAFSMKHPNDIMTSTLLKHRRMRLDVIKTVSIAEPSDYLSDAPQIENIEFISLLGKGGISVVYKARQKQLDRLVAVKVLQKEASAGPENLKRFQQEARLTAALDHPNIVKTISFGISADGRPYLVMEYLDGVSLSEKLKQTGRLKLQQFRDIILPSLSALDYAHKAGLIHRDLKPANIMLTRTESGEEIVKLVDFGIAKLFAGNEAEAVSLTRTGLVLGTPAYMSPEQCSNKTMDGRSDLYSMACVMYECLCGQPPFSGESYLEIMHKHVAEQPDPGIVVESEALMKAIIWGLEKDPESRPQSAGLYSEKLSKVLEQMTLDRVPGQKASRRTGAAPIALGCLVAITICGITLFALKNSQERSSEKIAAWASANDEKKHLSSKSLNALMNSSHPSRRVATQLFQAAEEQLNCHKYFEAEKLYRRCLEMRQIIEPNSDETAEVLFLLANCCYQQQKYSDAEAFYKRALMIERKAPNPNYKRSFSAVTALAQCYDKLDKPADAQAAYRECLDIAQKNAVTENEPKDVANALFNLGSFCKRHGNLSEAEKLLKRSADIREKDARLVTMGDVLTDVDMDARALVAGERAILSLSAEAKLSEKKASIREKKVRRDFRWVAAAFEELADLYEMQGKWDQAEALLKRAVELRRQTGVDPDLASAMKLLANCYKRQNKWSQAEWLYKDVVSIRENVLSDVGNTSSSLNDRNEESDALKGLAEAYGDLVNCYQHLGKTKDSEEVQKRLAAMQSRLRNDAGVKEQ